MLPETIGSALQMVNGRQDPLSGAPKRCALQIEEQLDIKAGCPCSAGIEERNRDVPVEHGATADASG